MTLSSQARVLTASVLTALALTGNGCGTTAPKPPAAAPAPAAPTAAVAPTATPSELPEPTFASTSLAQGALVGSVVSVAPKRIVSDLDALSQRLKLPVLLGSQWLASMGGEGVAGKDVRFVDLVERIDPQSTVAIVWTLPPEKNAKGVSAALTMRDKNAARQTAEEFGAASPASNGVVGRRTVDGAMVFTAIKGRTLFISDSAEALLLAGGLAEAAQVPPSRGQMVLTLWPQALAKASGKSPEALVADLAANMAAEFAKADTKKHKAMEQVVVASLETLVRIALDSSAVRLVVDAGPADGLLIQAELVPASGTGLAATLAKRFPYAIDTRLPVRSDSTSVVALGNLSVWLPTLAKLAVASGPAGQAAARDTQALFALTSEWSCMIDPTQTGLQHLCSATLKQGVAAAKAMDATVSLMTSQNTWEGELDGRKAKPLKIKRARGLVEIEKQIENQEPLARAVAKALAGGDLVKSAVTVKDGRLLLAAGPSPKDMLARYGAGAFAKETPLITAALTRSQGDEIMASIDIVSLLLRVFSRAKELPGADMATMLGAMPGVSELQAPFRIALRSGNSLVGEFHIPLASLDNIAQVVRGIMGGVAR